VFAYPVFISDVNSTTAPPLPPECPPDICLLPDRRFWGFIISILDWEALKLGLFPNGTFPVERQSDAHNHRCKQCEPDFQYRLSKHRADGIPDDIIRYDTMLLAQSPEVDAGGLVPGSAYAHNFDMLGQNWTLEVWTYTSTNPYVWGVPVIVVCVIIGIILASLVAVVIISNRMLKSVHLQLRSESHQLNSLVVRQYELIACFGRLGGRRVRGSDLDRWEAAQKQPLALREAAQTEPLALSGPESDMAPSDLSQALDMRLQGKITRAQQSLQARRAGDLASSQNITLVRILGQGSFGTVFLGEWCGSVVAVKRLVLPMAMSNSERMEQMAVMEVAISNQMCHPHIVQLYTYSLRPIREEALSQGKLTIVTGPTTGGGGVVTADIEGAPSVNAHELRMVMEFCDGGSLRGLLDAGGLRDDAGLNYAGLLQVASDVARGLAHLHGHKILHADLK